MNTLYNNVLFENVLKIMSGEENLSVYVQIHFLGTFVFVEKIRVVSYSCQFFHLPDQEQHTCSLPVMYAPFAASGWYVSARVILDRPTL